MQQKLKHLEFIQGVINRLATNSFQMKGWSVVLVAAILVLLARESKLEATYIALLPIVVFWGLDGYFLWQERLYRALYDHVSTLDEAQIDFSMNVALHGCNTSWWKTAMSRTLIAFYIGLILALVSVGVWASMCIDEALQ